MLKNRLRKLRPLVMPTFVAGMVSALVASWHDGWIEPQARAEPRRITPQEPDQHFKSGGRLSEAVLQEMLVVLKRIDERLERMEKSVDQLASTGRTVQRPMIDRDASTPSGSSAPIEVRRSR
jgi:hypothetical protein